MRSFVNVFVLMLLVERAKGFMITSKHKDTVLRYSVSKAPIPEQEPSRLVQNFIQKMDSSQSLARRQEIRERQQFILKKFLRQRMKNRSGPVNPEQIAKAKARILPPAPWIHRVKSFLFER
mmetsp:Transcript_22261/g.28804  ORF Transcript_22261/g.28804 Transcript_22261/m.28804 type:complete len:121 (+) Transcript_22261:85-447(+)